MGQKKIILMAIVVVFCALLSGINGRRLASQEGHKPQAIVRVAYHLWYNPDPQGVDHVSAFQNVQIEHNSTFYQVMVQAASGENENQYRFVADEFPFGHYIKSIGGYAEDTAKNWYWMIFKYPAGEQPDNKKPPPDSYLTPVGVDGIRVADGEVYLYWRKHVTF